MSRMAALVALPVSLAELLEVRGGDGLTAQEIRAVAVQTVSHVSSLLHTAAISAVPLRHVTRESLQLTGSGQVRLGHSEICADVYSVNAEDVPEIIQSLGTVMQSAVRRPIPEPLTTLLKSLRDGHVTLEQLPQRLADTEDPADRGRPYHEVVALLHEELLGMDSLPLRSPQRSPSQLELTQNPSVNETAIFTDACRGDGLLPPDSASVSHAGSFPEVPLSYTHTHRSRRNSDDAADTGCHGNGVSTAGSGQQAADVTAPTTNQIDDSKISTSTELRNASCMVAGNLATSTSSLPHLGAGAATAAAAVSADCGHHVMNGHRQQLILEKDMLRLIAGQGSAQNLATSTPNHSPLAPPTTQDASAAPSIAATLETPIGERRKRCRLVRRKPSALYGVRADNSTQGETRGSFYGPEFVIRAREKPRRVELPQKSSGSSGGGLASVLVVMLTGQKLDVACNPAAHTIADVTKAVHEEEPYPHPSLLGLAVLTDGQYLFPPPATRVNKALVSPICSRITLHQRFKLYPALEMLPRSSSGLHLLYLQLRQNLLENQLDVSSNQVVQLSALALLAEFGHRGAQGDDTDAYFLPEHYLPEPLTSQPELLRQLTEGHVTCGAEAAAGPTAAERRFVKVASGCRGYGRHRCSVDLRVKSYSTSTLSIDPSCFRLTRCDPSGRSTTRTLHWSTISKIEYKARSRRLLVSSVGAETITFCGDKHKLRCLEYMMQQHLTTFRDGIHLTSCHQVYRTKSAPSSPCLTNYCVRTPLSTLANRNAPIVQATPTSPLSTNQKPRATNRNESPANQYAPRENVTNQNTPRENVTNQNAPRENVTNQNVGIDTPTNGTSPLSVSRRRRSAGGALRSRGQLRSAVRFRSVAQLSGAVGGVGRAARGVGRAAGGVGRGRENSPPPAPGIRMGTRIPVSALQRQKIRSRDVLPHITSDVRDTLPHITSDVRDALPHITNDVRDALPHITSDVTPHQQLNSDAAYVIAAEIPPTPESALPPGVRRLESRVQIGATDGSTGAELRPPGPFNVTLHRCPRTGGLGLRVVRGSAPEGGRLHVQSVTADGPAHLQAQLQTGDVITHISGRPLSSLSYSASVEMLRRAVDPVSLSLIRRKRRQCDVTGDADDVSGDSDLSGGSQEKRLCRDGAGGGGSTENGRGIGGDGSAGNGRGVGGDGSTGNGRGVGGGGSTGNGRGIGGGGSTGKGKGVGGGGSTGNGGSIGGGGGYTENGGVSTRTGEGSTREDGVSTEDDRGSTENGGVPTDGGGGLNPSIQTTEGASAVNEDVFVSIGVDSTTKEGIHPTHVGSTTTNGGISTTNSGRLGRTQFQVQSVNDIVLTRLQKQLSGGSLATPTVSQ